ncbi:DNA mismatch repair protein, partial [Aspergillus sclerotialis]
VLARAGNGGSDDASTPDSTSFKHTLASMADRLYLDGASVLANQIMDAIDEEGLLQKQRVEDDTAAEATALAHEVAMNEGVKGEVEELPKK